MTDSLLDLSDGNTLVDVCQALQQKWRQVAPAAKAEKIVTLADGIKVCI